MIIRPPKGGPAGAGGHLALNLLMTLIPHLARMPEVPAKKVSVWLSCEFLYNGMK